MTRLPAVLDEHDLPLPELLAATLDGDLVRIDRAWVSIDEPDLRELRAAVLGKRADRDLIIERRSAAWVHGAAIAPPVPPEFCVPVTARVSMDVRWDFTVREVAIEASEVMSFGEVRCTTRARTVYDLLRDRSASDDVSIAAVAATFASDQAAAAALADEVRERLGAAHRLPFKRRALDRLAEARELVEAAQPADTR